MGKYKNLTLLIAEDDDELRESLVEGLTSYGFKVFSTYDGPSAVELLGSNNVDLVISDVNMPNGDCDCIIEYIDSAKLRIPAMIMSGFEINLNNYSNKVISGFLAKPFSLDSLLSKIDEIMDIKKPA